MESEYTLETLKEQETDSLLEDADAQLVKLIKK